MRSCVLAHTTASGPWPRPVPPTATSPPPAPSHGGIAWRYPGGKADPRRIPGSTAGCINGSTSCRRHWLHPPAHPAPNGVGHAPQSLLPPPGTPPVGMAPPSGILPPGFMTPAGFVSTPAAAAPRRSSVALLATATVAAVAVIVAGLGATLCLSGGIGWAQPGTGSGAQATVLNSASRTARSRMRDSSSPPQRWRADARLPRRINLS